MTDTAQFGNRVKEYMEGRCLEQRRWLGGRVRRILAFDYRLEHTRTSVGLARALAGELQIDPELAAITAWLHDLGKCADPSLSAEQNLARFKDHGAAGAREAGDFLNSLGFPPDLTEKVAEAILLHVGFFRDSPLTQPLDALVWDADKLSKISLAGTMHWLLGQAAEGREVDLLTYFSSKKDLDWRAKIRDSLNTPAAKVWAGQELELGQAFQATMLRTLSGQPPSRE